MAQQAQGILRPVTSSPPRRVAIRSARRLPELIFERHLMRKHGKKISWIEENRDDLRLAHDLEHGLRRACDHAVDEDLIG